MPASLLTWISSELSPSTLVQPPLNGENLRTYLAPASPSVLPLEPAVPRLRRAASSFPGTASHSLSVLSSLPDSTCVPSGEKATRPSPSALRRCGSTGPWPRPTV